MSFLAPYMLLGGLAAGIPIALHFFYRSRFRNVPWAAMKFLLTAIEQTSRRLRFQELLLLILRVALLLLLAFALSRPVLGTSALGRGDAVDAVFVIDQSMSMGARAGVVPPGSDVYASSMRDFAAQDNTVTRFDRARAAALAVLAGLPPGSTIQIIGASDRAALLGPLTSSHLGQAQTIIKQMTTNECGTDFEPAVTKAVEILESGPSSGKELYIFSDHQRTGFDTNATKIRSVLEEARTKVSVTFVRCDSDIVNATIVSITPQSTLRSGERADFAVVVRNTSARAARNLTVSLLIDENEKDRDSQPLPEIPPGETRAVVLSGVFNAPGRHVISAVLKSDDLPGDNRLDQLIRFSDQIDLLLVDGSPSAQTPRSAGSFFLMHALNPFSQGNLPVTLRSAEVASPLDLRDKQLCILVNARLQSAGKEEGGALSADFVSALASFVQSGRGLIIFPGDRFEPEPYNRLLLEQHRLLPYRIGKIERTPIDKAWKLDRAVLPLGPFSRFSEFTALDHIETTRRLTLEAPKPDEVQLAEESRTLLRYRDGGIAIAARRRPGQGEVVLFTTSGHDLTWSNLPIMPPFVPVVQSTLSHLLEDKPGSYNRIAGERLEWPVAREEQENNFDLVRPDDSRQRLGFPVSVGGRALLTSNDLTRAGVYRVVTAGAEATNDSPRFTVAPDVRETVDLSSLSEGQINERLGFACRHLTAGDDGTMFSGAERFRSEWTRVLLWVLLVLVGCEMALAWWCGRAW